MICEYFDVYFNDFYDFMLVVINVHNYDVDGEHTFDGEMNVKCL